MSDGLLPEEGAKGLMCLFRRRDKAFISRARSKDVMLDQEFRTTRCVVEVQYVRYAGT